MSAAQPNPIRSTTVPPSGTVRCSNGRGASQHSRKVAPPHRDPKEGTVGFFGTPGPPGLIRRRNLNTEGSNSMQITDILTETGGLKSIAGELGISESQAASGAAALLPAILGGFKKQAQSQPSGLEGLGGLLGQLGGGSLLEDVLGPQPTNVSRGNDVLGQIFGSKDVSRAVAQNAASQSGLDATVLKKMLPMVAMLVGGVMAKQGGAATGAQPSSKAGGLGGLLGSVFGGQGTDAGSARPGAGAAGLASMLDLDGDGNPLDDILNMVGKVMR